MNKTTTCFSDEEIQEIEEFKDATLAMTVDGEELICFSILYDLIQKKIEVKDISRTGLLKSYVQLKGVKDLFASFDFVDTTFLERIIGKFRRFIISELAKRRLL
ncbi:hypothetical protein [Paenibacillus ehimensis]|uniref:Uncharacterized protein n=1 Tax=Paenibacillus ehimensis TaxID=79264 RepID=A0ABT8VKR8_9BACL|nr:hypothetical protein [Paenibacillus ehimensis]MDO3681582.1 hypothetical protein [Paenibacillus ehimensis]